MIIVIDTLDRQNVVKVEYAIQVIFSVQGFYIYSSGYPTSSFLDQYLKLSADILYKRKTIFNNMIIWFNKFIYSSFDLTLLQFLMHRF